ncbi:MAG: NAD(P)/FAD-dependent oxidoreductase [Pseudomonadales bacterium]
MTDAVDVVVIGAGVVGLACARGLAQSGLDVVVIERHGQIGSETSSRNSEVIHAGIYYPAGSAKAALCVRGKELLYRYCEEHAVPHRRCGKIIVASSKDQVPVLRDYQAQALRNGVAPLPWLTAAEVAALEPEVQAVAGVLSESTGIIDSHAYMVALRGDLEAAGGMIALGTEVQGLAASGDGLRVETPELALDARWVVNAAGLAAPVVARWLCADAPRAYFARGHYYAYEGRAPFSRLVYPVAEAGGLGVHVTLDLGGQVRFGPDVVWIDGVDYAFDDSRRAAFEDAIRRYFPGLEPRRLHPGYTGIRPKISGPGEPAADFRIDGPQTHGVAGLINLLGIESPGLTASLAIAEVVGAAVTGADPADPRC